jgi:hypothetical protein
MATARRLSPRRPGRLNGSSVAGIPWTFVRRSNHVLFPGDAASHKPARYEQYCTDAGLAFGSNEHDNLETKAMSLGLILVILLVIFLFGGFSGRFGGYGYGYGHGGVGVIGTILIIVVILMLLGRI